MKDRLEKIRKHIQELAKQYNLKYIKNLYKVSFLTKKEYRILNFLTGCPDPDYLKFGKTIKERTKNISTFLSSEEFLRLSKKEGGSITGRNILKKYWMFIKEKKIRDISKSIYKKIKPANKKDIAIVLTIPENSKEKKFIFDVILFHEWIHILMIFNKIYFQRKGGKYWPLDEGLVTYIQKSFKEKKQDVSDVLKFELKNTKNRMYKIYARNALKFNEMLKDKNIPEKRKKAITRYYLKLKKQVN